MVNATQPFSFPSSRHFDFLNGECDTESILNSRVNFQTLSLDVIFGHEQKYWNLETLQLLVLQKYRDSGIVSSKTFSLGVVLTVIIIHCLKRTFVLIFTDGFVVILSLVALPVV